MNRILYLGIFIFILLLIYANIKNEYIENFLSGKDAITTDAYTDIEAKLYERVFNSVDRFNMDYDMIKKLTLNNYKQDICILDAGCGVGQHYNLLYKDVVISI